MLQSTLLVAPLLIVFAITSAIFLPLASANKDGNTAAAGKSEPAAAPNNCCPFEGAHNALEKNAAKWMVIVEHFNDEQVFNPEATPHNWVFECPNEKAKQAFQGKLSEERKAMKKAYGDFALQHQDNPGAAPNAFAKQLLATVEEQSLLAMKCIPNAAAASPPADHPGEVPITGSQHQCPCPEIKGIVEKLQALKAKYKPAV